MYGRESGSGGSAANNAGFGAGMSSSSSGTPTVEIDPRARLDGAINSQRSNNLVGSTGLSSNHYTKGLTDQQLHEQQQLIQHQLLEQQQHKLQQVGIRFVVCDLAQGVSVCTI